MLFRVKFPTTETQTQALNSKTLVRNLFIMNEEHKHKSAGKQGIQNNDKWYKREPGKQSKKIEKFQ